MMGAATLLQTTLPDLKLERRGKVRDVYGVDPEHLLILADREELFGVEWRHPSFAAVSRHFRLS